MFYIFTYFLFVNISQCSHCENPYMESNKVIVIIIVIIIIDVRKPPVKQTRCHLPNLCLVQTIV